MRPIKNYASQKYLFFGKLFNYLLNFIIFIYNKIIIKYNIYIKTALLKGQQRAYNKKQELIIFGIGFVSLPINVGIFCYCYENGETYIGRDTKEASLY